MAQYVLFFIKIITHYNNNNNSNSNSISPKLFHYKPFVKEPAKVNYIFLKIHAFLPELCQIKSQRIVEQMLEDCVRRMRIQMQETGMGERNRSARNLTSMGELDEEEQTQ